MINLHDAILATNPTVVTIHGDTAYDSQGNEVSYNKEEAEAYAKSQEYVAKRAAEYPSITDYLDGMVKNDQAQIQKYIDDCLAVKSKYPKPSQESA